MSQMPSIASLQSYDRETVRLGFIDALELLPGGTNPGPASKMVYTVTVNGLPGPFYRAIPTARRYGDEWDVDALPLNLPVGVVVTNGQVHILAGEERASEDCP